MSRIYIFLFISGLLLVAAACSSNNDASDEDVAQDSAPTEEAVSTDEPEIEEEPTATEEPAPTSTPEPEPTATVTPVETQEPSDDDTSTDEDPALDEEAFDEGEGLPGTAPGVVLDEFHDEELGSLLVSSEDMSVGWGLLLEGSLPDDAEATQGLGDLMNGPCGNEVLTPESMGNPVHVGRVFMGLDFGSFFSHDLYEFEDKTQAAEAIAAAASQLDCQTWTAEDPSTGITMKYTVEDLEFPDLGDETVAISLNYGIASETQAGIQRIQHQTQDDELLENMSSEIVMIRQGNKFSSFAYMNWLERSDFDLEEIITLTVERAESAQ